MAKRQPNLVHAVRNGAEESPQTPMDAARRTIRKIAPNLSFATPQARAKARRTLVEMLNSMKEEQRAGHLPLATAIVDEFAPLMDLALLKEFAPESWKGIKPDARQFLLTEMALQTISEMDRGDHAKMGLVDDAFHFFFTHHFYTEIVLLKQALFRSFDRAQLMEMRAELLKPHGESLQRLVHGAHCDGPAAES